MSELNDENNGTTRFSLNCPERKRTYHSLIRLCTLKRRIHDIVCFAKSKLDEFGAISQIEIEII